MKKALKVNFGIFLVICLCVISINSVKAIITDTYRVRSVESDVFSTTIRKVSEYEYVVANPKVSVGNITVTTSSGNLKCRFKNESTNGVSSSYSGNTCTIYGSIPAKTYSVQIFSDSEADYNNPKYSKTLTITVKNSDPQATGLSLKSVKDNNGNNLSTYTTDYYNYTYTSNSSSIKIIASSNSAICKIHASGVSTGLVEDGNTCIINKTAFKKTAYLVKITNGNSTKNYTISLTPTTGYSTSIESVTTGGYGNIVRKLDDGEYNIKFNVGDIKVTASDISSYCKFSSVNGVSVYSNGQTCGLYTGIKVGSYPFTVTNGKDSRSYTINVVNSDANMKDVSIKNISVNNDETLNKDTNGHYTIKHSGNLYFKVTTNSSNATCKISDYYKTTSGITSSANTCTVNLKDAQSGTYTLTVTNGDTTEYYLIDYRLNSGATGRMLPQKIVLDQKINTIYLNQGRSYEVVAIVLPGNAVNREVNWSSSNSSVASITESGMIYGESPGTATITATSKYDSSLKKSIDVVINKATANAVKNTDGNSSNNDATLKNITAPTDWFKIKSFDTNKLEYTADIIKDNGGGPIVATATDSKATVKICNSDGATGCISGTGSADRVIAGGLKETNTYLIIVTNGTATKTYTLTLIKTAQTSTPSSSVPSSSVPSSSVPSSSVPSSSVPSSNVPSSSVPSSSTPGSNNSGTGSDNKSYLNEIFDINNDKVVNQTDYSIISYYYLKSPKILNSKNFSIWKAHFDVINPNGIDLVNVKDVGFFILGTYSKVSTYTSPSGSGG